MNSNIKNKCRVLFIGKVPPPIGGVTIHVQRLMQAVASKFNVGFYDLSNSSLKEFVKSFLRYNIIHLHTSRSALRLLISMLAVLTNRKLIITFHSNIGEQGFLSNYFDYISIALCAKPIMLNRHSFVKAIVFNKRAEVLSAFIPPLRTEPLPLKYSDVIEKHRKEGNFIYCTNAFNVSFDRRNREIYGLTDLLATFSALPSSCLVISDPSGNYQRYVREHHLQHIGVPIWISEPHDFFEVLKISDGLIRNTTTDGDSLSIKEAMLLGIPVFATDIIDRPAGCILYSSQHELVSRISGAQMQGHRLDLAVDTPVKRLMEIYDSYTA